MTSQTLLTEARKRAKDILHRCATPNGFRASGLAAGYPQVWARDSMVTFIGAVASGDEELIAAGRASLETMGKFQSPLGLIQLNVDFNPEANSDALDYFYKSIFPDDCIDFINEFVGYLMIPSTAFEKAFVALGSGGNGKGTFLKVISHFLGEENVTSYSLHQIQDDKYATAGFLGVLANMGYDLDPHVLKTTSKFKSIVSGDSITAERKYQDHFKFKPFVRLVLSANQFPRSNDKTPAYFDRLIFVEFPKKFRNTKEQILNYDEVLIKKPDFMSALLNHSLCGLQRLMKNCHFSVASSSLKILETYKRECNTCLDYFEENLKQVMAGQIPRKSLYHNYKAVLEENGMRPLNHVNFSKALKEWADKITTKKVDGGDRVWVGIAWADKEAPKTDAEEIRKFGEESDESKDPDANF